MREETSIHTNMARAEKENIKHYKELVKQITGFKETDENFGLCLQFVTSNIKYHRFLDVDSHKVTRTLEGILDKFRIHSEDKKYTNLKKLSDVFLESCIFEQKEHGKTDTHYSVLQFLMLIAENPVNNEYIETKTAVIPDIEVEFNWGEYLLEGIERYVPSDNELSDWSDTDDDEDIEDKNDGVAEVSASDVNDTQQSNPVIQPYIVSDGSSVQWEEPSIMKGADWLSRNLVPQYWRGEKLEVDTGSYLACHLNNDWEAYKRNMDHLYSTTRQTVVTENILMREIVWMLMGISNLHLLEYNGRYFVLKPHIAVPHLSEEVLQECVSEFTRYGSYIYILQCFVGDSFNGYNSSKDPVSQTLESFSTAVGDFLQTVKRDLSSVEEILIKQEEILTLTGLSKRLKPVFKKVRTVFMVYMKGVHEGRRLETQTQRATLLLTTLYNMLLWCDTLFETTPGLVNGTATTPGQVDGMEGDDDASESAVMLNLLLPVWLQTCQPFINIIDTWISHGYLRDPRKEFIIHRNKDINTLEETFWEKSFAFHTMTRSTADEKEPAKCPAMKDEYQTADWAPKFLQPILQQVVQTGKSMEMLEVLGKLAEHDGKTSLNTREFKEGNLYEKFIDSLKTLLGMKLGTDGKDSDQTVPCEDQPLPGEEQTAQRIFTDDIDRQMKEKDVFDSFLKIHFEKLMTKTNIKDSIMEESFVQTMKSLNLENLPPIELILQDCLYPHVQLQYEKVCGKLVDILITEYQLLDYLGAMRKFFLMEAGDVMFIFYTEIFDKIRLHEHWKDTTSLTWALHDAVERQFPDEVTRLSIHVESTDGQSDNQPINVTDCLRLQYQIPSPVDVVINERCQSIYNQIFRFLLQVKRAKYCLDELRFYDLQKSTNQSESDRLLSGLKTDSVPRAAKIHRMHLLRMRLINFVNCLHNYMMTRILHSVGLEFARDLKTARDLDQIIEIHTGYVQKIHQRCLLHQNTRFFKEAVLKVLNLALRFQTEWDSGIDSISMTQIEDSEVEVSRCILFLSSFLKTVIQRGSFPHLEALAFGLVDLNPKVET